MDNQKIPRNWSSSNSAAYIVGDRVDACHQFIVDFFRRILQQICCGMGLTLQVLVGIGPEDHELLFAVFG
ncbi:MAG: hypothetical protein LCH99_28710 [Proteobacteria bacterium]|nr:hypothetical protein [Pseudomonadota bacterium]